MHANPFSRSVGASCLILSLVGGVSSAEAQRVGAAGVASRYTALTGCRVVRSSTEDVGFRLTRCGGVGGSALEVSTSDGRDDLAVVLPNRRTNRLNLTGNVGAGFGTIGRTAEWRVRGRRATGLIIRYDVAEDANRPERPTSYLVVVGVSPTRACVIGKIAPGRDQNRSARRLADAGGRCL